MRFSTTGALAALCASAHAFSDTSPFILYSTSRYDSHHSCRPASSAYAPVRLSLLR